MILLSIHRFSYVTDAMNVARAMLKDMNWLISLFNQTNADPPLEWSGFMTQFTRDQNQRLTEALYPIRVRSTNTNRCTFVTP